MEHVDVIVVGAGLAGLACAVELQQAGLRVLVLEASDAVGGRVRSETVDGFRLDRGFQIMLTAYPEAQRLLDYSALDLRSYPPGARLATSDGIGLVGDPLRAPATLPETLLAPIGGVLDKLRILRWRQRVRRTAPENLLAPGRSTEAHLRETLGFSDKAINRFLRPFLSGVFLDSALTTSSAMADYVWRMFSDGAAAIPAAGMQAIPEQLAARLPRGSIMLNTAVTAVSDRAVTTAEGVELTADAIVLATDMDAAAELSGESVDRPWNGTTCLWFAALSSPLASPHLFVNATGSGAINTVTVPTMIAPERSPDERHLVCVSIVGVDEQDDESLATDVRSGLARWFGDDANEWALLRVQRIAHALPRQLAEDLSPAERPVRAASGVWICGDHRDQSSIQGALRSGVRAAGEILRHHQAERTP